MPWSMPLPTMQPTQEDIDLMRQAERMVDALREERERERVRDQFAAAALTGLLASDPKLSAPDIRRMAFNWADSMLRERHPRNTMPKEPPQPLAWAVIASDIGVTASPCSTFMEAERLAARSRDHRKEIVPLFRFPSLTQAEHEAIRCAVNACEETVRDEHAATLRSLLDRVA